MISGNIITVLYIDFASEEETIMNGDELQVVFRIKVNFCA